MHMIDCLRRVAQLGVVTLAACSTSPAAPAAATTPAPTAPEPTVATPEPTVVAPAAAPTPPIPLDVARAQLAEADALCEAERGALWGMSLCGPIMLVDRASRFAVTNQPDTGGALQARDGVFTGTLPPDVTIANTALTWSGVHWTQVEWPLPEDAEQRAMLVMHERFHRIQDQIVRASRNAPDNAHLASLDGRYYLQLEWRALARALSATSDAERHAAVADALAFRRARRARFPDAAVREDALEMNEGLAAYTGVVTGQSTPTGRTAAALSDLTSHVADPSFMRSFAYATGPALGLLLDRDAPGWRASVAGMKSISDRLAQTRRGPLPDPARAATRYDGKALRAREEARAAEIATRLAGYRRALVEGPVVTLAFRHNKLQLDPRNVQPLDELGSVYPTLQVIDDWGILRVTGAALVKADWSAVVVAAPANGAATAAAITGDGWTLELAPGWRLVPDQRAGDLRLVRAE